MKKIRSSKKGFTLAELLIVVAIIGVLVGISIPIFTSQLEKSREATDAANIRAAKAAAVSAYLSEDTIGSKQLGSQQTGDVTLGYDAVNGVLTESVVDGYGKGTTAGAVNEDNAGKGISIKVTKAGNVTLTWASST